MFFFLGVTLGLCEFEMKFCNILFYLGFRICYLILENGGFSRRGSKKCLGIKSIGCFKVHLVRSFVLGFRIRVSVYEFLDFVLRNKPSNQSHALI